jgi:hypothetical protein
MIAPLTADDAVENDECVGSDELKRVVRLRLDIDADHIEPGPVVAHRRSAGAAEQVKQTRRHRFTSRNSYPSAHLDRCSRQPRQMWRTWFVRSPTMRTARTSRLSWLSE